MTRRPFPQLVTRLLALSLLMGATTAVQAQSGDVTAASLSADGPYQVLTYTDLPDVPEYGAATVYYPADAPGMVGGVAVAPGFTEEQRHINWLGPRLASHGYAVLTLDTNDRRDGTDLRAAALMAAVGILKGENTRAGSPLRGKVDTGKMAIMGHSMGGGGVLLAANEHSAELKAAIPLAPWEPGEDLSGVTVPTLIVAGSADRVAPVAEHAWRHFNIIPASTTKVYMEFDGGSHYIADTTRGADLDMVGRYAIAWLKLYMDGDQSYRDFIYGNHDADAGKLSRYVTSP